MAKQKLKTTDKQTAANRRNAQESTGPITPVGKAKASRNSLKHGLLASEIVLGGESREEFESFRDTMIERLDPDGELENMLAHRIVAGAWRLRRAGRIEQEMLDEMLAVAVAVAVAGEKYPLDEFTGLLGSPKPRPHTLGGVLSEAAWRWDRLNNVARYESHLERIVYKGLHELQRLQAARDNRLAPLPAALDISVAGAEAD